MATSSADGASLSRLRAAQIDGRTQSVRYRQMQLKALHEHLVKNTSDIQSSIQEDSGFSQVEAALEYSRAMLELRHHYENLNLETELKAEYSVAGGKSHPSRRVGYGMVYIIPGQHCRFHGIISALSAAISAGNCCVVELPQTTQTLLSFLQKVLTNALDHDTFTAISQRPDISMMTRFLIVHQGEETELKSLSTQTQTLSSPNQSFVVAVVDRTADVESAAASIVSARFCLRGQSALAPDCVLVNEFIEKRFLEAAVREFSKLAAGSYEKESIETKPVARRGRNEMLKNLLAEARKEKNARIVVESTAGAIVVRADRFYRSSRQRIAAPVLVVQSVSSLDHGIDVANSGMSKPLLATMIYADTSAAKYLSQFIYSSASFINHMPPSMLCGPTPPAGYAVSLSTRYTREMFERPSPQFVCNQTIKPYSCRTSQIDDFPLQQLSGDKKYLESLRVGAIKPLPDMGHSAGGQIGFFEQAILWGGVLTIVPALTAVLGGAGYGAFQGYKYFRT